MKIVRKEDAMNKYLNTIKTSIISLNANIKALSNVCSTLSAKTWSGSARTNFDTEMKNFNDSLTSFSSEINKYRSFVKTYIKDSNDFDTEMSNIVVNIEE